MVEYMGETVPKERDEESGKFTEVVTDEDILGFLDEAGGAGTSDVAGEFDYKRPTAYRRLRDLEEEGRVSSREIGNSLLWEVDGE